MVTRALPIAVLSLVMGLSLPASSREPGTLTVGYDLQVDAIPVEDPGPGGNMVFAVRRNARYAVSLSFANGGEGAVETYRLNDDGQLVGPVGWSPAACSTSIAAASW
jgi:hypothetical protein